MRIVETKINPKCLSRAKSFEISENHIFIFTGSRIIILDDEFNCIDEITGLNYVNKGYLSPDKTKLLLVSTINKFYILSLSDFNLESHTIREKNLSGNLEGNGCWSFDGNAVYIPAQSKYGKRSIFRKYCIDNFEFEDVLPNNFYIQFVKAIQPSNKYLLVCLEANNILDSSWNLIWYDGHSFEKHIVQGFDDAIYNIEIDETHEIIHLFGAEKNICCDYYGNILDSSKIELSEHHLNLETLFDNASLKNDDKERVQHIIKLLKLDNICTNERIYTMQISLNSDYLYIGSSMGLIIADIKELKIIQLIAIDYGVYKIHEFNNGTLVLSTWHGIKTYSIIY